MNSAHNLKKIRVSSLFFLLAAFFHLSCASNVVPAGKISKLGDKASVVFGKYEFYKNEEPFPSPDAGNGFWDPHPSVLTDISSFDPGEKLNDSVWLPGKYRYQTKPKIDGHFAFTIAPGKYYFVAFTYIDFFKSKSAVELRTFRKNHSDTNSPFVMTFNALPGQAIYIGTIQHRFTVRSDGYLSNLRSSIEFDITNDFPEAKDWLLKSCPQFSNRVNNAAIETFLIKSNNLSKTDEH
jgi:hypothetical protein